MQRASQGYYSDPGNTTAGLTPFQLHLLRRLDGLLTSAVPAAEEPWQIDLVGHALRYTLNECAEAGLHDEVTARLRAAGQRVARDENPVSSRPAGPRSNSSPSQEG